MNKQLISMVLDRCMELGNIVFEVHQELEKWRDPKYTDKERNQLSLKLQKSIEEQNKWLGCLQDGMEEDNE